MQKISVIAFPRSFSAVVLFFAPIAIAALVAPPTPIREAKAITSEIIGKDTPKPAKANELTSGIRPTNIRSTTLYNNCTNCAKTVGIAIFKINGTMGVVSK